MVHWRRPSREPSPHIAWLLPLLTILLAALAGLLATCSARADAPSCGDRADLVEQLREKYREAPSAIGMTAGGALIELFTSDAGTWTLVFSYPNGRSCLIATGNGWEQATKPKGRET